MKPKNLREIIGNIGQLRAEWTDDEKPAIRISCPFCKASKVHQVAMGRTDNLFAVEHEHDCSYAIAMEKAAAAPFN